MRTRSLALASLALLATLALAACSGSSEDTPTPTASATPEVTATPEATAKPQVTSTATASPTPAPDPVAGLWVIEAATGDTRTLYESPEGLASAWWEPGGEAITASIQMDDDTYVARRYSLDGETIEVFPDRNLITPSADGRSRYWYGTAGSPEGWRLVLEHDGGRVPITVNATTASGFSPAGDRLLLHRTGAETPDHRIPVTYWVVNAATGATVAAFNGSAWPPGDDLIPARWSPSGRYVATSGIDGLLVYDITAGTTTRLGAGGSTAWSPFEDAIVVERDDGLLEVVRLPSLARVPLATEGARPFGRFDSGGNAIVVSSYEDGATLEDPLTTVFDAFNGAELARWPAAADRISDSVVALPAGLAAWLYPPVGSTCTGFLLIHPRLPDTQPRPESGAEPATDPGRCIEGLNPRWSPDTSQLAFVRPVDTSVQIVVLNLATDEERVLATITASPGIPLARWNEDGTHLLVQRQWDGVGWHDDLD